MPLLMTADANPGTAAWSTVSASHAVAAAGTATIPAGQLLATVAVGAALNGAPVLCQFAGAPTAVTLDNCWGSVAGGILTVNIPVADVTALNINYAILLAL